MKTPTIYPNKLLQMVRQEVFEASDAIPWESSVICIGEWQDADGLPVQLQLCIQKDEAEFMESPQPINSVFCPEKAPVDYMRQMQHYRVEAEQLRADGVPALQRLVTVARGDTGQASTIARFLLGLYNDRRFPFPMTNLRSIDTELFDDCMTVLAMDARACQQEVHLYFKDGLRIWEEMAKDWGVRDHTKAYQP